MLERIDGEPAESAAAALALVQFAGMVVIESTVGELLNDGSGLMGREMDLFYATRALIMVAAWTNEQDLREAFGRERIIRRAAGAVDKGRP